MKLVLETLKNYHREPYPYYYGNHKRLLVFLFLISFLSFGFSYFLEPFEVNVSEHRIPSIWILVIHALMPLPIAYIYFSLMNSTHSYTNRWTLGKELLYLSILLLIIGVGSFLLRDVIYTNPDNWSFRYFWEEIRNTFLVGTIILLIVLPINLERLINKHKTLLKQLSLHSAKDNRKASVLIKSTIESDDFELFINDFLYAKVESNYTEIYMYSSAQQSKKLIRMTLQDLEEQLRSFSSVFRTHRSYLVNLKMIASISGNAQGYELVLKHDDHKIPVSRSTVKHFNTVYSKL